MQRATLWTAVATALVLLAGCAGGNDALSPPSTAALPDTGRPVGEARARPAEVPSAEPAKVALLLPLGAGAQTTLVADSLKRAAELAIVEHRAPHIQLMVRDDKGTPEGAADATREAIAQGAEVVLGPMTAKAVQGASGVTRSQNIPMIAFSTDRQVAGNNVHLLSFMAAAEVNRVVAFAAAKGKRRIAALVPDDAYGRLLEASLRETAAQARAEVVALERYAEAPNAMLGAVKRLSDGVRGIEEHGDPIDALFLAGGEETLVTMTPQLKQARFDPQKLKVIGTGALDYANAGREPFLQGAWFAAPDPKGWKAFSEKFAQAYGQSPPRIATLAYDAIGVVAALSAGTKGARFIPAQLTRAEGFMGVDGPFRLMSDGVAERALAVLEVQELGAAVIDAAPASAGGGTAPIAASGLGASTGGFGTPYTPPSLN